MSQEQVFKANCTMVGRAKAKFNGATPDLVSRGSESFVSKKLGSFPVGQQVTVMFSYTDKSCLVVAATEAKRTVVNAEADSVFEAPPVADRDDEKNWVGNFYFDPNIKRRLSSAGRMAKKFGKHVMRFAGDVGLGKTVAAEVYSQASERTFVKVSCSKIEEPGDFIGRYIFKNGETIFRPSRMTEALKAGNCVILFDEINRAEPFVTNAILDMTDDSSDFEVDGELYEIGKNVIIIFSMNEDFGGKFTGTITLDAALFSRIETHVIFKNHDSRTLVEIVKRNTGIEEDEATKIVQTFVRMKSSGVEVELSTRKAIMVGRQVAADVSLFDAIESVILDAILGGASNEVVSLVNSVVR